jgi:hypothetical protein
MRSAEEELEAIGFGGSHREPACWRVVRLDRPVVPARAAEAGREPASSPALMRWRELLARSPHASRYGISRVAG